MNGTPPTATDLNLHRQATPDRRADRGPLTHGRWESQVELAQTTRVSDVVDTGDLVVAGPRIEAMKSPAGDSDGPSSKVAICTKDRNANAPCTFLRGRQPGRFRQVGGH